MKTRVGAGGEIVLPAELLEATGLLEGSWIEMVAEGDRIIVRRTAHDPFEEAKKAKPEPPSLADLVQNQRDKKSQAREEFDQRIQDSSEDDEPPRPEDHPDFWR